MKAIKRLKDWLYCKRTGQVRVGDIDARGRVYERAPDSKHLSSNPFNKPARVMPKATIKMQVRRRDGTIEDVITVLPENISINQA